jgi:hypothetical protein
LAAQILGRVTAALPGDWERMYSHPELRRDLEQDADSHNSRLSVARYEAEAPFNWIRSLHRRPSSSIVHSESDCACGATNSTNAGGAVRREAAEAAAIRRFK